MSIKPESRLRQKIREEIRRQYPDSLVVSQPASETTGPGRTDFYVVVVGRYVGLEVKTRTGRATPIQLERIRRVRRAGGWAGVVRSPDEALRLITHALNGRHMWNNLFDDSEPDAPEKEPEIQAFPPQATEPKIEEEVRKNGMQPAGDGAMQEPPGDYPFAVIIQRLNQTQSALANLDWLVRALFAVLELEIPREAAPQPESEADSESPPPQPKPSRSRRKA